MDAHAKAEFTGGISDDLTTLARLLHRETAGAAGRGGAFFDHYSVAVNDGISMLVTLPWDAKDSDAAVPVVEYTLDGLAAELEALERRYWSLESEGVAKADPGRLAALDHELLGILERATVGPASPALDHALHLRFEGEAARPRWSLFVQNELLRKLVCAAEAESAAMGVFLAQHGTKGAPRVACMGSISPFAPLGLNVPRAVLQLRAQCLAPDVIIFPRRGLTVSAGSPDDLWRLYGTAMRLISEEEHHRLRKLPWMLQGGAAMLDEDLSGPAVEAIKECAGPSRHVQFWPSSRDGVVRKAICCKEVLGIADKGFPDHRTAGLGGIAPLVVPLEDGDGAAEVTRRVRAAWEGYRRRFTEETPLPGGEGGPQPRVIALAHLGVVTAVSEPDAARPAYAALAETLSVIEGARAFGGMCAVPGDEAFAIAGSPVRTPLPVAMAQAPEPVDEDNSAVDDEEGDDDDGAAARLAPPGRMVV